MTDRTLGKIVKIQIQRQVLKNKNECYDPTAILEVQEGTIGPGGITGLHDGGQVMDVHHAAHISGRGGGRRAVSIGFTGHYRLMGEEFAAAPLGVGGENLIIGNDERLFAHDLEGTIVIKSEGGDIELTGARVAAPCREFTSYLLDKDNIADRYEIQAELEFLGEGMRGFIVDGSGLPRPMSLRVGDEVVLRP